jgi:uncharacterized protein YbjT (DUF2867 family)
MEVIGTSIPKESGLNIVVAGASGYIGLSVIPKLLERFPSASITALSRSRQGATDPRVHWQECDLFSLKSIESSLPEKIDLAYYLVHSMGPTAQLDQGSFADYDLILADNFSRALKSTGVRHLIYLGGLLPDAPTLSLHLQSRLEVEQCFQQYALPCTIFRAGLILGEAGSSFQILLKLVRRLPIMICPVWTQTLNTPVDLLTVVNALASAAMRPELVDKIFDLAGCEPITYMQMMSETAKRAGLTRYFMKVPFFTPTLSRLWVRLITNTPKNLVYPLVESLRHEMVARKSRLYEPELAKRSYFELLDNVSLLGQAGRSLFQFRAQRRTVRSVQRLSLPSGKNAEWVSEQYLKWLPNFLWPLVKVSNHDGRVRLSVMSEKFALLELEQNATRSSPGRQLLYIRGGLLVARNNSGRLEFREVLAGRFVLAAIHDYRPALPWFIYKYTQALLHLLVMRAFEKHLNSQK